VEYHTRLKRDRITEEGIWRGRVVITPRSAAMERDKEMDSMVHQVTKTAVKRSF
jgi:hypothetical protein